MTINLAEVLTLILVNKKTNITPSIDNSIGEINKDHIKVETIGAVGNTEVVVTVDIQTKNTMRSKTVEDLTKAMIIVIIISQIPQLVLSCKHIWQIDLHRRGEQSFRWAEHQPTDRPADRTHPSSENSGSYFLFLWNTPFLRQHVNPCVRPSQARA